jgi:hypothetical protein
MASKTIRKPVTEGSLTKALPLAATSLPIASNKAAPITRAATTTKATPVKSKAEKLVPKTPVKAKPSGKAVATKVKKTKLVRDSFTIPKNEYAALQKLKQRAVGLSKPAKKGELLRAGLLALAQMSDTAFLAALAATPALKTGRPKGAKAAKK